MGDAVHRAIQWARRCPRVLYAVRGMSDVLIVGGGVIGLSLAYELAGHGAAVRVIDAGQPAREASWAGAGILPPARATSDDPLEQLTALCNDLHRSMVGGTAGDHRHRQRISSFGRDLPGPRSRRDLSAARVCRAGRVVATSWPNELSAAKLHDVEPALVPCGRSRRRISCRKSARCAIRGT